jgi:2-phosphoglycerate kinase
VEFGPRVVLIGGTSNAGKTTLAEHLAPRLGGSYRSTDYLARHPGRPWRPEPSSVPDHVAEHYLDLSEEELVSSVLRHYQSVWPRIESAVRAHVEGELKTPLILEGSAIWPTNVSSLRIPLVWAIWLTADEPLIRARILQESRYEQADRRGKQMIDKFLDRTCRFNRLMMEEVLRLHLPYLVVEEGTSAKALADSCVSRMRSPLSA